VTRVLHLLRFEVRRTWVVLALYLVIVAGGVATEGIVPLFAAKPQVASALGIVGTVLWYAQMLLTFAIVSLVIHADAAVGTDAFWMTRPIAPRVLLIAKGLVLGTTLVIVPALARVAVMLAYDVETPIIAGITVERVLLLTVFVTLLMAAAALTRNLAWFALLCGGTFAAVAASLAVMVAVFLARFQEEEWFGSVSVSDHDSTGALVSAVIVVVAAASAVAAQYRWRSRLRAVLVGIAGVVVGIFVESYWPWPLLLPKLEVPSWARDARAIQLTVNTESIATDDESPWFARPSRWSTIRGEITLSGLEPGWAANVFVRKAVVRIATATLQSVEGMPSMTLLLRGGADVPGAVRSVLGAQRVAQYVPASPPDKLTLFAMRREELQRHTPATGTYQGQFTVGLVHYVIEGVLPLRPGAIHRSAGYRAVLDSVTSFNRAVTIVLRESRAATIFARRPTPSYMFYLRNRARQEAAAGSAYPIGGDFPSLAVLPFFLGGGSVGVGSDASSGFVARGLAVSFPPRYRPDSTTLTIDDAWLADAELVIVRQTFEGTVERSVELPDFPVRSVSAQVKTIP
jgi:hypothetical protein